MSVNNLGSRILSWFGLGFRNRYRPPSDDCTSVEGRTREAAERALGKRWRGIQLAEALTRYGVDPETGKRINPYSEK